MKILAIETSAKSVSAAVVENGVPLASAYQNMGLTHSRTLMPLVDGMLSAAGLRVRDMDLLIRTELSDDRSVENGYRAFLESLDGALSSAVQEMGAYEGTDNLADAAVHFGLLSYAAGLVSRQYVAQLRARTKPAGKPDKAEAKKAAKSRKERKD